MANIIPPSLQKGDTIAIVSTARKISAEEVEPAKRYLEKNGFNVVYGQHLFEEYHQFAGTDKQRANDFQEAINNKNIKAIWCARGGYGTVRLLPLLDFTPLKNNPKWIVGYSDVTVLHAYINQQLKMATIHATMPINFNTNTIESWQSAVDALTGKTYSVPLIGEKLRLSNDIKGEIIGGNLSILYSLTGTDAQINTNGKILFIEDLDEYLYHIDRMMINLKLSGMLENLKALLVGGMTDMHDNTIPFGKNAKEIIIDATREYNYPVVFDVPSGHTNNNLALIFGKESILKNKCIEFNT
jgi:muramoyltetrapeptide carboxypeptidase